VRSYWFVYGLRLRALRFLIGVPFLFRWHLCLTYLRSASYSYTDSRLHCFCDSPPSYNPVGSLFTTTCVSGWDPAMNWLFQLVIGLCLRSLLVPSPLLGLTHSTTCRLLWIVVCCRTLDHIVPPHSVTVVQIYNSDHGQRWVVLIDYSRCIVLLFRLLYCSYYIIHFIILNSIIIVVLCIWIGCVFVLPYSCCCDYCGGVCAIILLLSVLLRRYYLLPVRNVAHLVVAGATLFCFPVILLDC